MAAATMSLSSLSVAAAASRLPQCDGLARQGLALPMPPLRSKQPLSKIASRSRVVMSASSSERDQSAIARATALALMATTVLPEIAEAAITPSLKNLLLSVAAGFTVLGVIVVAVLGFATFDPVKRQ